MSNSQIGKWSIAEAENAVKALFFLQIGGKSKLPRLRWRDFESLKKGERRISPRTLGKALSSLKAKGEIVAKRERKAVFYSLVLERAPGKQVDVAASADVRAIQSAARIDGIFAVAEGWSFYGVSRSIPRAVRWRIRDELIDSGERLDNLLDREANRFIHSLVSKARRLTPKERREAERGLRVLFEEVDKIGAVSAFSAWSLTYLEHVAPGATAALVESLPPFPSDVQGQIRWLSRMTGASEKSLERDWRLGEKMGEAIKRLMSALPPRERERAAREIGAWMQLLGSWCAVVR